MELPTKEQLENLPKQAIVAYAVRAAMRVLPLGRKVHSELIDRAISVAIGYCTDSDLGYLNSREAHDAYGFAVESSDAERLAASAAVIASDVAAATSSARAASDAVRSARAATDAAGAEGAAATRAAIADFERIALVGYDSIDPTENGPLGPLWPHGAPSWFTPREDNFDAESGKPVLTVVWDPTIVEPEEYAEIIRAIGDIVRSEGAVGLELIDSDTFGVPTGEEVPA